MKKTQICIRIPEAMLVRIEAIETMGILNRSAVVSALLADALNRMEDEKRSIFDVLKYQPRADVS